MENIYLEFYKQQTRKLHKDEVGEINLDDYSYIYYEEPYYILNHDILIGRLDRKKKFGFLRQEVEDVYIEYQNLSDAMHDDIVLVKEDVEPKVILVIERALKVLIATVKKHKKGTFYEPETFIEKKLVVDEYKGLVPGHVVLLDVESIDKDCVYASVNKIVGHINDPDINTVKIVNQYQWPQKFDDELIASLKDLNIDFNEEKRQRTDLTDQIIITIDGKDAKDLDDAISLTYIDNQYHLGVHIADVSHYVQSGSFVDIEAYARSTSAYLADRVIPMLPHLLSNDLCSLNPNEIKLTLSCMMTLDDNAKVINYEIKKSFISSYRRMDYDEVNDFLSDNKTLNDKKIEDMLTHMNELSNKLKIVRKKRGEIEFESSELGFKVDKNGKVLDVFQRTTDDAEELIESFMLIANETVAFHMFHADLPSIYRIHEKPDLVKLKNALQMVSRLGFPVNLKQLGRPEPLQALTTKVLDTPYSYVVHMMLLRAMQKAKYSHQKDIHYGLGATYYTHFTSPIRRYPDLMLHRLIHLFVLGEATNMKKQMRHYELIMPDVAKHTSDQERKAVQMERDVAKLKSCEYMEDKVGTYFNATISQMMPSGMFVKLDNGIEGFVALRQLDDYYMYNENLLTFIGRRGKKYKLGDLIKVELLSVDILEKKMDFGIIEKKKPKKKNKTNKTRR